MTVWHVAVGPPPGPSSAECCAWSDDDMIALATENVLHVLRAGDCTVSWKLSAHKVLAGTVSESSASVMRQSDGDGSKRARDDDDDGGHDALLLCPLQLPTQPIVGVSWSPLGVAPARGCLLCAAAAHECGVYARPEDPLRLQLRSVAQLSPLLHAALGHRWPPTERQAPFKRGSNPRHGRCSTRVG